LLLAYTSDSLEYHEARAEDTDGAMPPYPPLLVTTFPPQNEGEKLANHPDGWSECLLEGPEIKRNILSVPGFPMAVEKPPDVRHRIEDSPLGGLGVFATKELNLSDLIFAERPLLVAPMRQPQLPVAVNVDATRAEIRQATMSAYDAWFQAAVSRMNPTARMSFLALGNRHPDDGWGPGRFLSNAFALKKEPLDQYGGIHNEISRINHR
jgi:hypothetical protein